MNAVTKAETMPADVADYGGGILSLIERAVRDQSVDIDKMERLLAMQERVVAEASKRAFTAALREAKREIKPIVRNKYNEQTKSRYADLEAVADAIDPVVEKHGFVPTFGTGKSELADHYQVTCDLLHVDGYERHYFADVPVDTTGIKGNQNKTATHGFGSTMSYARRYLKLLIFDVATTDNDGNRDEPNISADQCAELRQLIKQAEVTEESFCDYIKVGTLPELAARNFERAKGVLNQKINAGAQ